MSMIIFFVCSLINVILSTIKSVLTVKASKQTATLISAISYGFNALVLKQLTEVDLWLSVITTILTNIIGVYVGLIITEKFKSVSLWKISVTSADKIELLDKYNIPYTESIVNFKNKTFYSYEIYSDTKEESKTIKSILENYDIKYNVMEVNNKL